MHQSRFIHSHLFRFVSFRFVLFCFVSLYYSNVSMGSKPTRHETNINNNQINLDGICSSFLHSSKSWFLANSRRIISSLQTLNSIQFGWDNSTLQYVVPFCLSLPLCFSFIGVQSMKHTYKTMMIIIKRNIKIQAFAKVNFIYKPNRKRSSSQSRGIDENDGTKRDGHRNI